MTTALALTWVVTAVACSDTPTAPDDDALAAADEFSAFDLDATFDPQTIDRGGATSFDELAAEIPGFAGYFIDRACNINVLLVDLSQSEKATKLLTPLLRRLLESRRRCPTTATILVLQAEYSWLQLKGWLHKLRPLVDGRAVLRMGIAIPHNRIVIALASRSLHARVLAHVQALDVPVGAVMFKVTPPPDSRRTRG